MPATQSGVFGTQQFTNAGSPLVGGRLYTYATGTTTLKTAYTDVEGTIPHTYTPDGLGGQYLALDARGELPSSLYLTLGAYDLSLKRADASTVWTRRADGIATVTDLLSGAGASAVGVSQSVPVAVPFLQTVSDIVNGQEISVFRFIDQLKHSGIRGETDNSDLLAAFQTAASAAKAIALPFGKYFVSGRTMLSKDGAKWRGQGINASKIVSTVNNVPVFGVANFLSGVTLEDFQIDRNIAAIAGGDGIDSSTVSIGQALFRRLLIQNSFHNMNLGPTDYSEVEKCILQKAYGRNLRMTNTATDGACQWSLDSVLMQFGDAGGLLFQAVAGAPQVTLGTWKNIATFANGGLGVAVLGLPTVPVNDVRIVGGFIGEDANSEIYLDTYGRNHMITGAFVELAGRRTTGRTLQNAASNLGSGVEVTGNNVDIQMTGVKSDANSLDGYYLAGVTHPMGNCQASNNGLALAAGRRNGVNAIQGRVVITGGSYINTGGGASQQYGAFVADGNNLAVIGADLSNNAVNTIGATTNASFMTSIGNLPNTGNVLLSPQGAVVVGGTAVAGASIVGGINVAGGLSKNNVAYNNP